jgi:glycogen operon protein
MRLAGDLIAETDERGEPITGDTLLVLLNAHHEPIPFVFPPTNPEHCWERLFDTADDTLPATTTFPGDKYDLRDRSVAVFRTRPKAADQPAISAAQADALGWDARRVVAPAARPGG